MAIVGARAHPPKCVVSGEASTTRSPASAADARALAVANASAVRATTIACDGGRARDLWRPGEAKRPTHL